MLEVVGASSQAAQVESTGTREPVVHIQNASFAKSSISTGSNESLCRRFINWLLDFLCCRKKQSKPVAAQTVVEPEKKSKLKALFEKANDHRIDKAEVKNLLAAMLPLIQAGDELGDSVVRGITRYCTHTEWRPLFDAILVRRQQKPLNTALDEAMKRLTVYCEDGFVEPIKKLIEVGADVKTVPKGQMEYFQKNCAEDLKPAPMVQRANSDEKEESPIEELSSQITVSEIYSSEEGIKLGLEKMLNLIQQGAPIDSNIVIAKIVKSYNRQEGKPLLDAFIERRPTTELLNEALSHAISNLHLSSNRSYIKAAEKLIAAGADGNAVKYPDGTTANDRIKQFKEFKLDPNAQKKLLRMLKGGR